MKDPAAQSLGKRGGEKSVISRFKNMTKEQVSEAMKKLRNQSKKRDIIKKTES